MFLCLLLPLRGALVASGSCIWAPFFPCPPGMTCPHALWQELRPQVGAPCSHRSAYPKQHTRPVFSGGQIPGAQKVVAATLGLNVPTCSRGLAVPESQYSLRGKAKPSTVSYPCSWRHMTQQKKVNRNWPLFMGSVFSPVGEVPPIDFRISL